MTRFDPSPVICGFGGLVNPGTTTGCSTMSDVLTEDASVRASIKNDTSNGGFKILALKSWELVTVWVDSGGDQPGEPHHKPVKTTDLQQVGQSDGHTPLLVKKGQQVSVEGEFVSPAVSIDTARTADLEIVLGKSSITVQLSALVEKVVVAIPAISLAQGGTLPVQITVTSLSGPPTTVSLSVDSSSFPDGTVSLQSSSVSLSYGSPATVGMQVNAQPGAPGSHTLTLNWQDLNGSLPTAQSFQVTVVGKPR